MVMGPVGTAVKGLTNCRGSNSHDNKCRRGKCCLLCFLITVANILLCMTSFITLIYNKYIDVSIIGVIFFQQSNKKVNKNDG